MSTTDPIAPPQDPSVRDMLAEILPVLGTIFVAGPPVVVAWAGTVLLALMLAGPFALLVTLVLALAAATALLALAGAILVSPYLLVRHLRTRWAGRASTAPAALQLAPVHSPRVVA